MKNVLIFILAFSILILPYGCTTLKSISIQQIPEYSKKRNFLLIKTPKADYYQLNHYQWMDEYLEGYLSKTKQGGIDVVIIQINSKLDVSSGSPTYVRIELKDITNITYKEFKLGRTLILTIPIIALIVLISIMEPIGALDLSGGFSGGGSW